MPPEALGQFLQAGMGRNYSFATRDGSWTVNLTRTFVALSTTAYERWEGFRERFGLPLRALLDVYQPSFFTRIGLRYVDVIKRSAIGVADVPWRDLLSPTITGMLGSQVTAEEVESFESVHEIRLPDGNGRTRVIAKLGRDADTAETTFVIDSDFFDTSRTDTEHAIEKLDSLHSGAFDLIRWVITERLHEAMEPQPL